MATPSEKNIEQEIEDVKDLTTQPIGQDLDAVDRLDLVTISPSEENKILRKIDWRVIPILTFFYLLSFIDRSNSKRDSFHAPCKVPLLTTSLVGNAKVAGLNDDLKLHGLQYNVAVTLFYVPYTLLEVPCNVLLKLMRPSLWISILLFSWGLVMTLVGPTPSIDTNIDG